MSPWPITLALLSHTVVCRLSIQRSQQPVWDQHWPWGRLRNPIFQWRSTSNAASIQEFSGLASERKPADHLTLWFVSLSPSLAWLRDDRKLWCEILKQNPKFSGKKKKKVQLLFLSPPYFSRLCAHSYSIFAYLAPHIPLRPSQGISPPWNLQFFSIDIWFTYHTTYHFMYFSN